MLTKLREFPVHSDTGEEMWLCECLIENDTTDMVNGPSVYRDRYFRQRDLGMRSQKAVQIRPGVFQLEDGREFTED